MIGQEHMASGLDCLGAGEGLGTRYVTVRVKSIDTDKLQQKIGSAAAAIPAADALPDPTLRAALPYAANLIRKDYGIDLEWQISKVPLGAKPLEENSSFGLGMGAGVGVGVVGWLLLRLLWKRKGTNHV